MVAARRIRWYEEDRQEHALEPGNYPLDVDGDGEDACNTLTDVSLVPV